MLFWLIFCYTEQNKARTEQNKARKACTQRISFVYFPLRNKKILIQRNYIF